MLLAALLNQHPAAIVHQTQGGDLDALHAKPSTSLERIDDDVGQGHRHGTDPCEVLSD